jgi:protein required for attachment to host cells
MPKTTSVAMGASPASPRGRLWLICNASRAHLFREGPRAGRFERVASFEHPEGRSHVVDLVADAQGRKPVGGSRGAGAGSRPGGFHGRPGAESDTAPKEVEAQKFARELAAALEKERHANPDELLGLVAPPHFLGLVRAALGERRARRIEVSIDKDLAALTPREIERRLRAERAY